MTSFSQWLSSVDETFKNFSNDLDLYNNLIEQYKQLNDEEKSDRCSLLACCIYGKIFLIYSELENFLAAEKCLTEFLNFISKNFLNFSLIFNDNLECDKNSSQLLDLSIRIPFSHILITLCNDLANKNYYESHPTLSIIRCLKEAENLYYEWEKQNPQSPVIDYKDLLTLNLNVKTLQEIVKNCQCRDDDKTRMEKVHMMTMESFATIYNIEGKHSESAYYCLQSLKFQHSFLKEKSFPVDHIDWALNAATLSQYFSEYNHFRLARHMIACARKVLNEADVEIKENENESFRKAGADLDIIEVKYCLMILDESYKQLENDHFEPDKDEFKKLLNDIDVLKLEEQLPLFPARNYQQAKKIFHYALTSIERAKSFFTIDERCSDYINCTFDHSQIYGSMMPFIKEIENQCKMIKRRIDLLENVLKDLNPQYFLRYCRKLLYELGNLYFQQVSLKLQQQEINFEQNVTTSDDEKQQKKLTINEFNSEKSAHVTKKINMLVNKSITNLYRFLATFDYLNKDKSKKKLDSLSAANIEMYPLPKTLEDQDYIQSILTAYMMIGKMYTKLVISEPEKCKQNWLICDKYYQELNTYLEHNVEHREKYFQKFYEQMLEMLQLIRIKISKL